MLRHLEKNGIKYETFRCAHLTLMTTFNRYGICLICNMVGIVKPGISRLINRFIPGCGVEVYTGPEVNAEEF